MGPDLLPTLMAAPLASLRVAAALTDQPWLIVALIVFGLLQNALKKRRRQEREETAPEETETAPRDVPPPPEHRAPAESSPKRARSHPAHRHGSRPSLRPAPPAKEPQASLGGMETASDLGRAAPQGTRLVDLSATAFSSERHPGAHPSNVEARLGAAKSGPALFYAKDLEGMDRMRAAFLWAEVLRRPQPRWVRPRR